MSDKPAKRRALLVTGMSGAGKTTALKILEDIGYEVVDNLPLSLLRSVVQPANRGGATLRPLALCIDVRTREFDIEHFERDVEPLLANDEMDVRILFLDCNDEVLRRRFTETRRRHPLAGDRPVRDGIRLERQRVAWFRQRADLAIDTTELAQRDFNGILRGHFADDVDRDLGIFVVSFAFRHGLPPEADLVFDVRFLRNPYYEPALKPLSGREAPVGAFVSEDSAFQPFFDKLKALLVSLLPAYEREGKAYLTVAIGCTGGRHRSVYVAERVAEALRTEGREVGLRHRDLWRGDVIEGDTPDGTGKD